MRHTSDINKKVVLVYIITLIVGLSYGIHNPIVTLFSKDRGSYFDLGMIEFSNFISYIFIPLFVGLLPDRFNNCLLFFLGLVLDSLLIYLLSIADSVQRVIIFGALIGIAHSFFGFPANQLFLNISVHKIV